ncbi:MAG TPA: VOC family protein [Gemmatimonadales bacterium]|nr:VOC family protein [Gemmatimonadales bacterium]
MSNASAPWIEAPRGHRLPGALRLGRVSLQVAHLTRSADWYERVLGLTVVGTSATRLDLGTPDGTALVHLHERRGAVPVPRRGRLGLFHYALLLPDRPSLGRFVSHIGEIDEPVGASDHLVSEAIYLTDPDGLGIEVYADRPRESWRQEGDSLAMATLRLDVRDLVRSAGDTRWTGMPDGTTMGHIHLHVSNLEQGAAFYHSALGLDRLRLQLPGALFMSAGGYHHHLGTNIWAPDARPAEEGDARLLEWNITLPNQTAVNATYDSLAGAGYTTARDGDAVTAADPWGTALRLSAVTG